MLCGEPPMNGCKRCHKHGGAAERKVKGSATTVGRYSSVVKGAFKQHYEASLKQDLLDPQEFLAIVDMAQKHFTDRLDDGDSPGWRAQAVALCEEVIAEKATLDQLHLFLRDGRDTDGVTREIRDTALSQGALANKVQATKDAREHRITESDLSGIILRMVALMAEHSSEEVANRVLARIGQEAGIRV